MKILQSAFADALSAYIKLLSSLGYRLQNPVFVIEAFDRWVFEKGYGGPLTQELVLEFASNNPKNSIDYRARLYEVIRHFSEYLAAFDPQTPRLDPKVLPRCTVRNPPCTGKPIKASELPLKLR